MASLTLKDLPEGLLEQLRQQAQAEHRSLNKEAVFLLEAALQPHTSDSPQPGAGQDPRHQVASWRQLSGRWASDESSEAEIAAIYRARTTGRDVVL